MENTKDQSNILEAGTTGNQKANCRQEGQKTPSEPQKEIQPQKDSRQPVVVDQSYPYEELLMVMDWTKASIVDEDLLDSIQERGLAWIRPEQVKNLRGQWTALLARLKFADQKQAEEIFDGMYNQNPQYFSHHLYGLLDSQGNLAAVTGIWPGSQFGGDKPRIHWMMTSPDFQGQGLASLVLQKALHDFREEAKANGEHQPLLWLSTQAGSWPAIRMYQKYGFQAFEGDSQKTSAQINREHWKHARALVFEKENVQI